MPCHILFELSVDNHAYRDAKWSHLLEQNWHLKKGKKEKIRENVVIESKKKKISVKPHDLEMKSTILY